MLIAVNYHYVRPVFDLPYPGIHGITPATFESLGPGWKARRVWFALSDETLRMPCGSEMPTTRRGTWTRVRLVGVSGALIRAIVL